VSALAVIGVALLAALGGLALAPLAEGGIARWQLRARVAGLARPRIVAARRPSRAAPLLRAPGRASDAALQRWLPGGTAMAAALATAGGRLSLTALAALSLPGVAAVLAAALAAGLPLLPALLLLPVGAVAAMRLGSAGLARRARAAFAADFPDAVAMIIRSLRAGLPVAAAIAEVARGRAGPVAAGFATVVEDMRLGQPIDAALWTLARRIGLAECDFLVVTIALQRETGGNLAETLGRLDETLRQRRQLALKVRALAAEARASALIIGSLPFAMAALLWLASPAYLLPLVTTALGKALLAAGLGSIAIGGLIINAMLTVRA
jgi:tight adherence protein B